MFYPIDESATENINPSTEALVSVVNSVVMISSRATGGDFRSMARTTRRREHFAGGMVEGSLDHQYFKRGHVLDGNDNTVCLLDSPSKFLLQVRLNHMGIKGVETGACKGLIEMNEALDLDIVFNLVTTISAVTDGAIDERLTRANEGLAGAPFGRVFRNRSKEDEDGETAVETVFFAVNTSSPLVYGVLVVVVMMDLGLRDLSLTAWPRSPNLDFVCRVGNSPGRSPVGRGRSMARRGSRITSGMRSMALWSVRCRRRRRRQQNLSRNSSRNSSRGSRGRGRSRDMRN